MDTNVSTLVTSLDNDKLARSLEEAGFDGHGRG